MAEKLIEVKLTKCVLFLPEHELLAALPDTLIEKGLKAGKSIQRYRKMQHREKREIANEI